MSTRITARPAAFRWAGWVLAVALFVRAGLWFAYPLAESNDSLTYRYLARSLANHGFERYNGTRTPGYPVFLMLLGADGLLYAIQLSLGLLITLLVFYIAWSISRRAWFAGLLALAHTLNPGQFFFEGAILSETLATFLLFCMLAGLVWLWTPTSPGVGNTKSGDFVLRIGIPLAIGLAAALLALTRPLFAFLPFWAGLFLAFAWRPAPPKLRWSVAILAALPALVSLAAWTNFLHTRFNTWGMDSIAGYHLVNHVSSFFERVPDEYALIRDTFLDFRARQIAESGTPINTIWGAIPTLMKRTRLNYYSLGRQMGQVSLRLVIEHPGLYARNLLLGWGWFWRVGVFWLPETISSPPLRETLKTLMLAVRAALIGVNSLFVAGSLALILPKIRAAFKMNLFLWFAASAIWLTSIIQTLAEHGDNPRYLVPMQSLVVFIVACWAVNLVESRRLKVEGR